MKINENEKISFQEVTMPGAKNVKMKILIGIPDGSNNIIMRYFSISKDGNTPWHNHNYEHIVKIEKGQGIFIDSDKIEHQVTAGMSIFVEPNTMHQFKNINNEPFEFICIIPNPEKNNCTIK